MIRSLHTSQAPVLNSRPQSLELDGNSAQSKPIHLPLRLQLSSNSPLSNPCQNLSHGPLLERANPRQPQSLLRRSVRSTRPQRSERVLVCARRLLRMLGSERHRRRHSRQGRGGQVLWERGAESGSGLREQLGTSSSLSVLLDWDRRMGSMGRLAKGRVRERAGRELVCMVAVGRVSVWRMWAESPNA